MGDMQKIKTELLSSSFSSKISIFHFVEFPAVVSIYCACVIDTIRTFKLKEHLTKSSKCLTIRWFEESSGVRKTPSQICKQKFVLCPCLKKDVRYNNAHLFHVMVQSALKKLRISCTWRSQYWYTSQDIVDKRYGVTLND